MDNLSPEKRSKVMRAIKGKNTRLELQVRRILRGLGIGYRLSDKTLPAGKPDVVMKGRRCVVFVNGCFWHMHHCKIYKPPTSRIDYWHPKLANNVQRDIKNWNALLEAGWRVVIIWECALQGSERLRDEALASRLIEAINGSAAFTEIGGQSCR